MKMLFVAVIVWDNMAELGPNYNIQCMKLFQELKASFPSIPDSVVRHCMKQVSSRHFDFNYVILMNIDLKVIELIKMSVPRTDH